MKLETDRLILREWTQKDKEDLIDGLNNIEVSKWLALVPYPYTKEEAESWINSCMERINKGEDRYDFAIELKENGKVIGGTNLERINRNQGTAGGGGICVWLINNIRMNILQHY